MAERRLGRGLDFLLSGDLQEVPEDEIIQVHVEQLRPNGFQPRRNFPEPQLEELAASIREHGVLQPVIVRRVSSGYELIAGERRWRACRSLGMATIPALVRDAGDTQMLEIALVENLQREDLDPIEVAWGFSAYIERLGLTQQEAADRLGKSRPALANALRLLDLPLDVQELVSRGTLSAGHARALLALSDAEAQRAMARRIQSEGLSVRATEAAIKAPAVPRGISHPRVPQAHLEDVADRLKERLGTRVSVRAGRDDKGRIVIDYFSSAELERLVGLLLGEDPSL